MLGEALAAHARSPSVNVSARTGTVLLDLAINSALAVMKTSRAGDITRIVFSTTTFVAKLFRQGSKFLAGSFQISRAWRLLHLQGACIAVCAGLGVAASAERHDRPAAQRLQDLEIARSRYVP